MEIQTTTLPFNINTTVLMIEKKLNTTKWEATFEVKGTIAFGKMPRFVFDKLQKALKGTAFLAKSSGNEELSVWHLTLTHKGTESNVLENFLNIVASFLKETNNLDINFVNQVDEVK